MWSDRDMGVVRRLLEDGFTTGEVAEITGVPFSTIGRWRQGRTAAFGGPIGTVRRSWKLRRPRAYSYLLGMYLGDGTVCSAGKVNYLRVCLDAAYPRIVAQCAVAMRLVMPDANVRIYDRPGARMQTVDSSTYRWLEAFPQHGPGPKHERPIVLADWQRDVVDEFPQEFLRGLIDSDGCRTINRFKTKLPSGRVAEYAYPRYFFSNLSADIRGLFCEYCDRLGIRWSLSNPRNVSVSHRASVALLDEFVGPKA
jgi:hypothetical protein